MASSTHSVPTRVRELQYQYGRGWHTFHAGSYPFPSDEEEIDRMNLEHQIHRTTLNGRLHLSPLPKPQEILDLGTGSGKWAIEMADLYSTATVTGIDLCPMQPEWVPPNCTFLVDDFESSGSLGENKYDFIHARFLTGSVKNFTELYTKAYRALRPGGWIEVTERSWDLLPTTHSQPNLSWTATWCACLKQGLESMGKQCLREDEIVSALQAAGFERTCTAPFRRLIEKGGRQSSTSNDDKSNEWAWSHFFKGLDGWSLKPLIEGLGWSDRSVRDLTDLVRIEMCSYNSTHWRSVTTCIAQKSLQ